MRKPITVTALFVLLLAVTTASAQQATVQKDGQAIAILQTSFAAMGGTGIAALRDTSATGEITTVEDDGRVSLRTTLRTLGRKLRVESDTSAGKAVYIADDVRASTQVGANEPARIPRRSLLSAGITHFPLLTILGEWADSTLKIEYVGAEKEGTSTLHRIRLQRQLRPEEGLGPLDAPCEIFINSVSLLPVRLIYYIRPPANLRVKVPMEVQYSDWRNIQGFLFPFRATYATRGQFVREIVIQSLVVNSGLQDADFQVR